MEEKLSSSLSIENVKAAKLIFGFVGSKTDLAKYLKSDGVDKEVALVSLLNSQGKVYYGVVDLNETIEANKKKEDEKQQDTFRKQKRIHFDNIFFHCIYNFYIIL